MTLTKIYQQALNDIMNSKSKDVADLRKIALKAFAQRIKEVAMADMKRCADEELNKQK